MVIDRRSIFIYLATAILAFAAPPRSKPLLPASDSSTPAPRVPISLFDLFLPPSRDASKSKSKSNSNSGQQSFLNLPGLAPPSASTEFPKQKSQSLLGGALDFSQLTRLCETMASANRAKKMSDAVQVAASRPNDLYGWMELIRHAEPIPFETFACQMIERLLTNPDEFVADLMRMFVPASAADLFQQSFPQFNLPPPITPSPSITAPAPDPTPISVSTATTSTTAKPVTPFLFPKRKRRECDKGEKIDKSINTTTSSIDNTIGTEIDGYNQTKSSITPT